MSQSRARKQRRVNNIDFMLASALMMDAAAFTRIPRYPGEPLLPPSPDAASRARVAAAEAKRERKRARAVQLMKRGQP